MPKRHALTIICSKRDGKLWYGNGTPKDDTRHRKLLAAAVKHLPDGPYALEIVPFELTRRAAQNRFYWGVVLKMIAEEMGEPAQTVHEIMKYRHNGLLRSDFATGEEIKVGQSTAKLTVAQFSAYLDAVMLDGAEYLGLTFPEPRASEEYRDEVAHG